MDQEFKNLPEKTTIKNFLVGPVLQPNLVASNLYPPSTDNGIVYEIAAGKRAISEDIQASEAVF